MGRSLFNSFYEEGSMIIGTSYFQTRRAADRYYQRQGYDDAELQIREGLIRIGVPEIAAGESLSIIADEGRYQIHCASPTSASVNVAQQAKKGKRGVGTRSLNSEVALLTEQDGCIVLPEEALVHYAEIKSLILKGGGHYDCGTFRFPSGIDAARVLSDLRSGSVTNRKQERQAFFTPLEEAHRVCRAPGELAGLRVLEPSAGHGALADVASSAGARLVLIENDPVSIQVLRKKGYDVVERDFLQVNPEDIGLFDVVVANPPFSRLLDVTHVLHMARFVKAGGCISTIMSIAWETSSNRRAAAFREFLSAHNATVTQIAAGAFKCAGTGIATTHVFFRVPIQSDRPVAAEVVTAGKQEQFAIEF
jgi:predicted RNA methylase